MDERTRVALEGSIHKWQAILDGTGKDLGADNCPLCALFNNENSTFCVGCPVYEKTGMGGCDGTPYDKWRAANRVSRADLKAGKLTYNEKTPEHMEAARAELDFLKSLRPEQ